MKLFALSAQGVDTDQNVRSPKVVEALLGTRLKGRSFTTTPLVSVPVRFQRAGSEASDHFFLLSPILLLLVFPRTLTEHFSNL
jgi:hypothetical protein